MWGEGGGASLSRLFSFSSPDHIFIPVYSFSTSMLLCSLVPLQVLKQAATTWYVFLHSIK
jgi:hypothetical protein